MSAPLCPLASDPPRLAQACSLLQHYPMDDVGLTAAFVLEGGGSRRRFAQYSGNPPPAAAASPNRAEAPPAALVGRLAQGHLNETHLLCVMLARSLQNVCKVQDRYA